MYMYMYMYTKRDTYITDIHVLHRGTVHMYQSESIGACTCKHFSCSYIFAAVQYTYLYD